MRNWTRTIAGVIAPAAVLALAACQGEPRQETAQPAEQQEVAQATYTIAVTNPMPHVMIVTADYGTGEPVELGPVEPMSTRSFTVTSPPSTNVTLSAQDADKTHTVRGEVTLTREMATAWTIAR